jgi:hypothetical protein
MVLQISATSSTDLTSFYPQDAITPSMARCHVHYFIRYQVALLLYTYNLSIVRYSLNIQFVENALMITQ